MGPRARSRLQCEQFVRLRFAKRMCLYVPDILSHCEAYLVWPYLCDYYFSPPPLCLPCVWVLAKMIPMMPTATGRGMVESPGVSDQSAWWTKACPAPATEHIVPSICFA